MKKNIRLYSILLLLLAIISITIYGVFYAIKNYNRSEIMTLNNLDIKPTIGSEQLDNIKLPKVDLPLIYDKLPDTTNTLAKINYNTFKKLFQTKEKSILILVKDDCTYCKDYLPIVENLFNELNMKAYIINISNLSKKDTKDLFNYIDYDGTPTTYIINEGSAKHTLTGIVDKETLSSFIDYFYSRNN